MTETCVCQVCQEIGWHGDMAPKPEQWQTKPNYGAMGANTMLYQGKRFVAYLYECSMADQETILSALNAQAGE